MFSTHVTTRKNQQQSAWQWHVSWTDCDGAAVDSAGECMCGFVKGTWRATRRCKESCEGSQKASWGKRAHRNRKGVNWSFSLKLDSQYWIHLNNWYTNFQLTPNFTSRLITATHAWVWNTHYQTSKYIHVSFQKKPTKNLCIDWIHTDHLFQQFYAKQIFHIDESSFSPVSEQLMLQCYKRN